MRISTRGSYALEAVLALALFPVNQTISIREISERTQISDNYLEQIFSLLRKKGIISSSRGAHGGYYLGRSLSEITVGDVLRATEKSIAPVLCIEDQACCNKQHICVTRNTWCKLNDVILSTVDEITMEKLVDGFRVYESNAGSDYSI